METVRIAVRDGDIADAGSWLYVWTLVDRPGIVYVGGTGLPPVVRAWLHLHHEDPSVARLSHRYPAIATEPLEVMAFRLPSGVDRTAAKAELVRQLHSRGSLATDYVGEQPVDGSPSEPVAIAVRAILTHLF